MDGKKDGKQKYRVRVNYQDRIGESKQIDRVAYGFDEAKKLERELQHNLKEEIQHKNLMFRELFNEYILVKKNEIRESSLDKTKRIFEYHVFPILENVKLKKLTLPVLQKWKLSVNEKELALRTRRNIFSEFRALLNYAVKMEYIMSNPLVKLGNFKDSSEMKKDMLFYTPDEFKAFISMAKAAAKKEELKNNYYEWNFYVFFSIAFYTGLRKGEIHALQWSDIDNGYLSVKRSITQKIKGEDRETLPKNRSSIRILQLPNQLIKILNEHKYRCKNIAGFSEKYKICGGDRSLRDTTIQHRNQTYSMLANVKTIRIHDFRHFHASLLANEGINIQEIARRLGHSKIEITWNKYSHLYPREEERAVKVLEKIV